MLTLNSFRSHGHKQHVEFVAMMESGTLPTEIQKLNIY